ncbi:MAG: hypothetical protein AAB074_15565 [Planctomycetota bacterium]
MPVYLELFHGTETTDRSELNDWGEQGPILGPLSYVHTTYAGDLKCCPLDGEGQPDECASADLQVTCECLLYYDGMYYGDWSVTDESWARKSKGDRRRFRQVDATKTDPPPVVHRVRTARTVKRG